MPELKTPNRLIHLRRLSNRFSNEVDYAPAGPDFAKSVWGKRRGITGDYFGVLGFGVDGRIEE